LNVVQHYVGVGSAYLSGSISNKAISRSAESSFAMGRLLMVHPCPVCNYYVEGDLHEGGSGISGMFLRNRYMLANCHDCHNLVSVLVANSATETQDALRRARGELVQMEADAVLGDERARSLLPLFRAALDDYDGSEPAAVTHCTLCDSANLELHPVHGPQFDAQEAWVLCPACHEGQLLLETNGYWD
jgi:hypothetical protein